MKADLKEKSDKRRFFSCISAHFFFLCTHAFTKRGKRGETVSPMRCLIQLINLYFQPQRLSEVSYCSLSDRITYQKGRFTHFFLSLVVTKQIVWVPLGFILFNQSQASTATPEAPGIYQHSSYCEHTHNV